jgi:5-oxoprolinase (ATP-hydrolysing) subunit A
VTAVALNTDVGEGYGAWRIGDDEALLEYVTAANVACGFHAGDPDILRSTCAAAAQRGVSIGAQVSYNDLPGFGRRFVDVPEASLVNDLLYQIGALETFARLAGTRIAYVKAHGALYNAAAHHGSHADAIVESVRLYDPSLPILCQSATLLWQRVIAAGLIPYAEAFIDRGYADDGTLIPRTHPQALLTDPQQAAERAVRIVASGMVGSVTGQQVRVAPVDGRITALCVHSDTPGAVAIAAATLSALRDAGIDVVPISATSDAAHRG